MSTFLQKLWDETLAGPTPDNGLGKLRRYELVSGSESPQAQICNDIPVTRSITILKRNSDFRNFSDDRHGRSIDSLSGISSPRTPTTPGTPDCDLKRFPWRRSSAESFEQSN